MKFEKVSFEEFKKALNVDEEIESVIKEAYDRITLPKRSTEGSAGYDFVSPFEYNIVKGEEVMIPTGIRAQIDEGYVLMIMPRSSYGIKKRMYIANTVPVIDSDYYYADNEGHIFICVGTRNEEMMIPERERFAQGVFLPFGVADDDNVTTKRTGGIGSTDDKNANN